MYSSLYEFWASHHLALSAAEQNVVAARRDAYSVILFDHSPATCISNNFDRSTDELLDSIVLWQASGGANYAGALAEAQSVMDQHWSKERYVFSWVTPGDH